MCYYNYVTDYYYYIVISIIYSSDVRRHVGEWVGPDPPLMFRPLLRLAQHRWEVYMQGLI